MILLLAGLLCAVIALGAFRTLHVRAYQHNLLGTWRHTTWIPGSTESYYADGTVSTTLVPLPSFGLPEEPAPVTAQPAEQARYSFAGLLGNYLRVRVGDQSSDRKIVQLTADTLVLTQYDDQPPYVLEKIAP